MSAAAIGGCFSSPARNASCNYGIGSDGRVVLVVDEKDRSWCSSSSSNDNRAVTIECASDKSAPYAMNSVVYEKLVRLCADICLRNGIKTLLWLGSKEKTLAYTPKKGEAVLTAHRWFANKSCPGDWLYSRYGDLAKRVNKMLGSSGSIPSSQTAPSRKSVEEIAREVIAGKWGNGDERRRKLAASGYSYAEVQATVIALQNKAREGKSVTEVAKEVIYGRWGNGDTRIRKLKAAGYNPDTVQKEVNRLMKK